MKTATPTDVAGRVWGGNAAFLTTRWTLLREAANSRSPESDEALEQVCRTYWYPLYAYVRRSGKGPEEAKDLTQGFFEHVISRKAFKKADPEIGRFRSFLLSSLQNYVHREHRDANRIKRGGNVIKVPLEWDEAEGRYSHEPADDATPERLFDRNWVRTVTQMVLDRLREEFQASKELERFEALQFTLEDPRAIAYADVAKKLGMSEAGVKSAVHRLRQRFRTYFREAVADSLDDPRQVDQEIRHLMESLA